MKLLRNGVLASLLLMLCVTLVSAQPGQGGRRNMDPEAMAQRQTERMTEQLTLSEAQTSKIKEVNLAFAKKMQTMREEADGDGTGIREKMQALRTEQKVEYKKYLTTEQFTQWEKLQSEQRLNRRRGRGNRNGDGN